VASCSPQEGLKWNLLNEEETFRGWILEVESMGFVTKAGELRRERTLTLYISLNLDSVGRNTVETPKTGVGGLYYKIPGLMR